MERFATSAGPILTGEVMGSALFRMSPGDVPALRRKPGPIPEGWGRVPPSLLRNSDEQTIAGTAAVFTAMEAMGRSAGRVRVLGRRGRVAVPGAGEPGRRSAELSWRRASGAPRRT